MNISKYAVLLMIGCCSIQTYGMNNNTHCPPLEKSFLVYINTMVMAALIAPPQPTAHQSASTNHRKRHHEKPAQHTYHCRKQSHRTMNQPDKSGKRIFQGKNTMACKK